LGAIGVFCFLRSSLGVEGLKNILSQVIKGISAHLLIGFLCTQPTYGQLVSPDFSDFLERHIGFSASDSKKIEQGKVLTKALDTRVKSEVALGGLHSPFSSHRSGRGMLPSI
jgi:hypothetical protein